MSCAYVNCPDENQIVAWLQGRLGEDEISEIDAALARCSACFELSIELIRMLFPDQSEANAKGAALGEQRCTQWLLAPVEPSIATQKTPTRKRYVSATWEGRPSSDTGAFCWMLLDREGTGKCH